MLVVAIAAAVMIIWRVLGPLPRVTYREVWLACPWVDRDSGNWSITRTICLIATFSWVHVVEKMAHAEGVPRNPFNGGSVSVLALIMAGAFSKNISDFTKGADAIFQRLRRKSDRMPRTEEPEVNARGGD